MNSLRLLFTTFSQWYFPSSWRSTNEILWEIVASSPFPCPSRLRRSLARSRETLFIRPKRRACSQATLFPILTFCPAQPDQLGQGETIRACASVAGSDKGDNFFLILTLAEVDSAGTVTRSYPGRLFSIQMGHLARCKRTQQLQTLLAQQFWELLRPFARS